MLTLVLGENSSGKSLFAERLAVGISPKRYYIATMRPFGQEGEKRVQKHLAQRAGLDFRTMELPLSVGQAEVTTDSVVLLEDVSNLLSNNIFENGRTPEQVYEDILLLAGRCRALVAVSIDGLCPDGYDEQTRSYIGELKRMNQRLAELADTVILMREGHPTLLKGELTDESLLDCD